MCDFCRLIAKVVLTKHSRRPKVKTFDGVEELSSEQRDGIFHFLRCKDVSAVLPTGSRKSVILFSAHSKTMWDSAIIPKAP